MRQTFRYNPECDLHVVDSAVAGVDLRRAYVNGSVPAGAAGSSIEYNDVEDPATLMPHPSDDFEALRQSAHVKSALKEASGAKSKEATE